MENKEVDYTKEKDAAKSMLKLVEQSLQEQAIKKERSHTNICPSNNWNVIRKRMKAGTWKPDKKVKQPQPQPKNKKKKKKRHMKEESKLADDKGGSVVDQIFYPLKHDKSKGITPIVALDWEMVEVDHSSDGLARVSIVNYNGHVLMDTFVVPRGKITNYRSWVSGIYPSSMENAMPYNEARKKAIEILKDRIIVGHSLKHDFKVLNWEPLQHNIRDLVTFKKFQDVQKRHPKSLKKWTAEFLGKTIQTGSHSSVIDARAALGCYRIVEHQWNQLVKSKLNKIKRVRIEGESTVLRYKKREKS